jgi:hypothetical protein
MSRREARYYRSTFTLWRVTGTDEYGDSSYSEPINMMCQFKQGGSAKYTDARGREFQPQSTIWTELRSLAGDLIEIPKFGDLIAIGTSDSPEPVNAYPVATTQINDVAIYDDIPDYMIMTG